MSDDHQPGRWAFWGIVVIVLALALVVVAVASAHYLPLRDAKLEAKREAAEIGARVGAQTSIGGCHRRGRHVVDCTAVYRFPGATCERTIRVKFRSPTSRRLRVTHPHEPVCDST